MSLEIKIKKVNEDAVIPDHPYEGDAGFDLRAAERVELAPMERSAIPTGLAFAIPKGHAGLIWDKSGVSIKKGQKVLGGVIDAGYRGEVLVGIINHSDTSFVFEKGDKIAQMLIQKVEPIAFTEVDELDDTQRGEKGFGSSGT